MSRDTASMKSPDYPLGIRVASLFLGFVMAMMIFPIIGAALMSVVVMLGMGLGMQRVDEWVGASLIWMAIFMLSFTMMLAASWLLKHLRVNHYQGDPAIPRARPLRFLEMVVEPILMIGVLCSGLALFFGLFGWEAGSTVIITWMVFWTGLGAVFSSS